MESLFSLSFMVNYKPEYNEIIKIVLLTNGFIIFLFVGFLFSNDIYKNDNKVIDNSDIFNINILKWVFYILFLFSLFKVFKMIWLTYQQGYMALYSLQGTGNFSIGTVHILFMVVFGLVTYKKGEYKSFLILFIIYSLLCGLTGARGGLVTGLLTSIYVYSKHNKVDVLKLFIMLIGVVLFMTLIFTLSSRAETATINNHSVIEKIIDFLYVQGNTLSIIGYSISGKVSYPPQAIYQAFLPLAFRIYCLFHSNVEFYTANISAVTAYTANSVQYLAGYGLGSSIVSETFNIFAKTITASLFISFLLGFFMGSAESKSKADIIYWAALLSVIPNILFLSRSGYNDIFPALIYAILFLFIIRFLFSLRNFIKRE
ncbi:O-antigen polysaccharide polymerase Wzy [Photobacterium kishitanii]|uniref:O-antigen polysaccharide polymerase Wzy n=1 Tax=Photobacterium kishitanii TaxID=318456 RepID=UPI00138FC3D1|nr:O-antigen polysaccharide polymerase Wzy [Photobacterium kishitanii]